MRSNRGSLKAELRSAVQPTEEQLRRFEEFLAKKYKRKVPLHWEKDEALRQGFRLQVGADMYDWTLPGRVRQFRDYVRHLEAGSNDILPLMRQAVENWTVAVAPEEIGAHRTKATCTIFFCVICQAALPGRPFDTRIHIGKFSEFPIW